MKRVLIDNQIYDGQKFGGISRYFNELKLGNNSILQLTPYDRNTRFINKIELKLKRYLADSYSDRIRRDNFYNNQIQNLQFDVFHPTYYDNYFLDYLKKPFVLTVHDMIHEKFAEYFTNSADSINKKRLCIKASKIIAVSKTTKKDLIDIFDIPESKIKVIYHATNFESISKTNSINYLTDRPFLLFTGKRQGYKNFLTFLIAVAPILIKNKDLILICTGVVFNTVETKWIVDLGLANKVINHFCQNDSELAVLYENAECFIFPSLYEGFGFPILEAFASNCPVVCSATGSLNEIAQQAAVYFNPKDIKQMRTAINTVLDDDSFKKELTESGKVRLKNFSWEKCRNETNLVYNRIV